MADQILPLLLFLVPLAWSPGPGNAFFAALGAAQGLRAAGPALLGYHLATWGVTVLAGAGASGLLGTLPALLAPIRWVGCGYILWLAWRLWRAGAAAEGGSCRRPTAAAGALLLLLNPKAYVIVALMFAQFLDPAAARPGATVVWIATVFTLHNLVAFVAWTLAGRTLARAFGAGRARGGPARALAVLLAASGVWTALGA